MKRNSVLWRYLKLLDKRLWIYLTAIFMMTAFNALFDVIGSVLTGQIFDIAQSGQFEGIYTSVICNVLIGIAAIITAVFFMNIYNNEAKRGCVEIKKKVFAKAMRLPVEYYDTHHSGDLLSRLVYDTDKAGAIYASRLRRVLAPMISVVVYIAAMLMLNPLMTVILAVINIMLVFVNTSLSKPMEHVGKVMAESFAKMTEKLSNIISGIEISKIYDVAHMTEMQYKKANQRYVQEQKKKMYLSSILESFNVGFDLLCALMFLVVGVYFLQLGLVTIGEMAAIYTMYGALSFRFLQLGKYYPELINCIAYAERIFEFLESAEENNRINDIQAADNSDIAVGMKNCDNAVEIENIVFAYDSKKQVFDGVSLNIPKGKTAAVTGRSGGGKSTLAKLMLGFYPYKSGDIRFFGKSMKKLGTENVRKLISYVPQEPYLFEVSIMENIRYGRLWASDSEMIEAAKLANAHDFILKQQNGYDTLVSDRGQSLSGGERQRIAIARAILKDAPIMLFDEATSALDNESEKMIQQSIDKLKSGKTIIIIAHRAETIAAADMELRLTE